MVSKSRILANLGKAVDSATTGHFLAKGVDSNGIFETILYTDLVGTPTTLDSALTSQLIDSSYVQLRQTASGGGIDSAAVTTLIDSSYVAARSSSGSSGFVRYEYDTTANATTFQDSDKTGQVLSYTEDYILVHYNGILMADTDYTATSGSSVVFSSGVDSGGIVSITKFSAASSGGGGSSGPAWYGPRGLFGGGATGSSQYSNVIDYVTMASAGNATDFGDLTEARQFLAGLSDATYGLFGGGETDTRKTTIDYVTIATTANATDFGDITEARHAIAASSNGTIGLFANGYSTGYSNVMDYITVATPGNATDFGDGLSAIHCAACGDATYALIGSQFTGSLETQINYVSYGTPGNGADFGDLTQARLGSGACSSTTRGLWAGGVRTTWSPYSNVIDYVTIATPGNATDFGDLDAERRNLAGMSSGTRGVFGSGYTTSASVVNVIGYVTIDTPGNSTDFGDLTASFSGRGAAAGNAA